MCGVATTHPREGPRYGHSTNSVLIIARDSGSHRSVLVPAPMLRGGLAKMPASRRQTMSEPKFCDRPAPRVNKAKTGSEIM